VTALVERFRPGWLVGVCLAIVGAALAATMWGTLPTAMAQTPEPAAPAAPEATAPAPVPATPEAEKAAEPTPAPAAAKEKSAEEPVTVKGPAVKLLKKQPVPGDPLPTLPDPKFVPSEVMPETPPWPSDHDLPILKQYKIDWQRGDALLEDVQDYEFEFETGKVSHDAAALYFLLQVTRQLPVEAFAPASEENETSQEALLSQPDEYRGVPVTVSGVVEKVSWFDVPRSNVVGLDRFWVVDIYQQVGGLEPPWFTIVLSQDPGTLSKGDRIRVKGYFFKIRQWESGSYNPTTKVGRQYIYNAPILVGRTYKLLSHQTKAPAEDSQAIGLMIGGMVGLGILAFMVVLFVRRQMARSRSLRTMAAAPEVLSPAEEAKRVAFLEQIEQAGGEPGDHLPNKPCADK